MDTKTTSYNMQLKSKRMSLNAIAPIIGISRVALAKMMSNGGSETPSTVDGKNYYAIEVIEFWLNRAKKTNTDVKKAILEEELRLKRVKADEAEKKVIKRSTVVDLFMMADVVIETVINNVCQIAFKDDKREREKRKRECMNEFKFWRDFIKEHHDGNA